MRLRWAIPTVMNTAERIFAAVKSENLPSALLDIYHSKGAIASRYADESWRKELGPDAALRDHLVVSFLAYRPGMDQPAIIAEIMLSMWQDETLSYIRWHPSA